MASNYEVNIKLNTRTVNKQLNNLEKRISKLNKLAQGGRANRAVNKREKERLNEAVKLTRQEQRTLRIKQKQLKVDQQQLKVEQQTANAISKQKSGGGSGITTGGGKGSGVLTGALISGAFPLLFGQGPLAAAGGFGGGLLGGKLGGQMGGFAGGLIGTSVITGLQNFVSSVAELGKSIETLDGRFNLLTEKSLFSSKEAETRAKVLQALGEREKLATLVSKELVNVLGVDGAEKLRKAGEASKELNKEFSLLVINLQTALAGPIAEFFKLLNRALDQGTSVSLGKGKGDVRLGPGEEEFLNSFKGVLGQMNQSQLDRILRAQVGTNVEGINVTNQAQQAIRKFSLVNQVNPSSPLVGGEGGTPGKTVLEVDAARVANAQKRVKTLEKEIEFGELVKQQGLEEAQIQQQIMDITEGLNAEELKLLETQGLSVRALVEKRNAAKDIIEEAQKVNNLFSSIGQTIETGLVDAIEGAIQGTKTLGEVASSVFAQIQRSLLQFGVNSLLGAIGIPGFANGGRPPVGRPSIVGEKGPELFVPDRGGTIIPNNQLGGSTNVVVNVDASGSAVEGDEDRGRELGRLISVAVQSEIVQQKRPGGLLA